MKKLLSASVEEATTNIPVALMGCDARLQAAIDNPVAYVMESKRMLLDFLSLLLGKTAEGFFNQDEAVSCRWTQYFRASDHSVFQLDPRNSTGQMNAVAKNHDQRQF